MDKTYEQHDARVDLGSVVEETKGAVSGSLDAITLPKNRQGIADD